jgi:PPP family 3-phenylpropionic acid transporter
MNLLPFYLSSFYYFYFSIVGVYIIFMPKILADIGYSASEIGILFSAAPLVRVILPFLFQKGLSLNVKTFNTALLFMIVSSLSFYTTLHNFYALLLSNIFLGVGMSLTIPYIESIALESIGKQRYGKVRLFGSVGFILVALVLVKFLQDPFTAIHFLVTMICLSSIFGYIVVQKVHTKEKASHQEQNTPIPLLRDYQLWIGLTLMQMSFGSFYNFFTIYETDHGVSMDTTIYLWSFGVVVEVLMLFFQGKLLEKNLLHILIFTTLATVLRWFLVFAFAQNLAVLFFAQSLHALSFALFHSAAISYLFHLYKNKALAQQFFSGITYGLGGLVGAVLAGYIYEYFPKYLFLSSSFLAAGASLMLLLYAKKTSNP